MQKWQALGGLKYSRQFDILIVLRARAKKAFVVFVAISNKYQRCQIMRKVEV